MKIKCFFSILVVAAFMSVTMTSCKKDVSVTGVTLDIKTQTLAEKGQFVLKATVLPENAANKNVTWESSAPTVASVTGGVVSGVSAGTAKITVKTADGGFTASCDVTVTRDVTGVKVQDKASVVMGEEITLTATIEPAGATDQSVTWSKGDGAGDVTLTPSGLTCKVKGVTVGDKQVIVTTGNGKKATCVVTVTKGVVDVESVELDVKTKTLPVGEKFTLTAAVKPDEATNKKVTWTQSSANGGEVTLTADGLKCEVAGKTKGKVIVTVTTEDGDKKATCEVDVITIGADFTASAVKVYDYSGTKKITELYKDSWAARYAEINKDNVLISGRIQMGEPAYLKLSDLKNNNPNPPFERMNVAGIAGGNGGEFYSVARLAHGQVYATNLHTNMSSSGGSWFRLYNWPTIDAAVSSRTCSVGTPSNCLYQYKSPFPHPEGFGWSDEGDGTFSQFARFGDNMTIDVDESGKGYMFCMGYGMLTVMRITLPIKPWLDEAGTAMLTPDPNEVKFILPGATVPKADTPTPGYQSFNKVDGATNEYLYSSTFESISLVDADGNSKYRMTSFKDNYYDACAARIINFNNARYLVTMNDVKPYGEGVIAIYDITDGETTAKALENFDKRDAAGKAPKYTFSLNGNIILTLTSGEFPGTADINFVKEGDTLYIIGSADNSGFAIIELKAQ